MSMHARIVSGLWFLSGIFPGLIHVTPIASFRRFAGGLTRSTTVVCFLSFESEIISGHNEQDAVNQIQ